MSYYLNKALSYFKSETPEKSEEKEKEEEKDNEDKKEEEKKELSGLYYYWDKILSYFRKDNQEKKIKEEEKKDDASITSYIKNPMLIFKRFDRNGDGKITQDDFILAVHDLGLGKVGDMAMRQAFSQLDKNKNGVLDFTEALAALNLIRRLVSAVAGAAALAI